MFLTLESILSANDLQPVKVACPEWGGDMYLLPFDGEGRDWYDQWYSEKRWGDEEKGVEPDWRGLRAGPVARQMCDELGNRLNREVTDAQILALGKKNGAALDRCWCALRDASGLGPTADEDAEKNLPATPPAATG